MTDDHELDGLDPYDILDREAARIDSHLSSLQGDEWDRPSRCEGWSVRDLLAHLAAGEEYHHACLDGDVSGFLGRMKDAGAADLESANAFGIAQRQGRSAHELLEEWRAANAETRRRFRERGDGTVDTSIGDYPARWQAFHVAMELATHADDAHIPETDDERESRRAWRARTSRFALAESRPEAEITVDDGLTRVRAGQAEVVVGDADLIEGVASRLDDRSGLTEEQRALLGITP